MVEVIIPTPPVLDGLIPNHSGPNYSNIPNHLINATGKLGNHRGTFSEIRGQKLLGKQEGIVSVVRNGDDRTEDALGHDLALTLYDSPVRIVYGQIKSHRYGIVKWKQRIRDSLPLKIRDMEHVSLEMTRSGIILLNCGQTKSDDEIEESFTPQLERIKKRVIDDRRTEASGQMTLFPETDQIQIWPWVPKAKFTQLFP